MAANAGKATVYISGDDKQLKGVLGGLKGTVGGALSGIGGMFKNAFSFALGGVINQGINAVTGSLDDMVKSAMEAQTIGALTDQVIKSTGGAAGMTAEAVGDLAEALSGVTKFEDDAIQAGENLLLSFTNIGKDVFPDVTEAMLDMSEFMGQDMKTSAMQLGKALNDPVKGIGALTKVGVTFTEQQKDQIKAMVKAGDVAGAQKVILAELNKEFGGAAKAAGKTFAGQLQIVQNQLGNLKESIGTALLPLLTKFLGFFTQPEIMNGITGFVEGLIGGITTVADAISGLITGLQGWGLDSMFSVWEDGSSHLSAFLEKLGMAEPLAMQVGSAVANLAAVIGPVLQSAVDTISASFAQILPTIQNVLGGLTGYIGNVIGIIVGFWETNGASIVATASKYFNALAGVVGAALEVVRSVVTTVIGAVSKFLAEHGEEIQNLLGKAWRTVSMGIDLAVKIINRAIIPAFQAIARFISDHGEEIQAVMEVAWTVISTVIETALILIQGIIAAVSKAIEGDWEGFGRILRATWEALWHRITGIVKEIDWGKLGRDIVTGIGSGISSMGNWLKEAALSILRNAMSAMRGFLGIRSPSKMTASLIGKPMAQGIGEGFKSALGNLQGQLNLGMGNLLGGMQPAYATAGATYNFTINAPGGDPAAIKQAVMSGLQVARSRGY